MINSGREDELAHLGIELEVDRLGRDIQQSIVRQTLPDQISLLPPLLLSRRQLNLLLELGVIQFLLGFLPPPLMLLLHPPHILRPLLLSQLRSNPLLLCNLYPLIRILTIISAVLLCGMVLLVLGLRDGGLLLGLDTGYWLGWLG